MVVAATALFSILIAVFFYAGLTFNRFVRFRKTMNAAFSDIDVFLRKRHDLVPELVATVKGYAAHEREVLKGVTEARSRAMRMTAPADKAVSEEELSGLFRRVFAVAENYPDLKADGGFRQLQSQLYDIEGDIAKARRYYNAVVRENNILVESFPSNIVGGVFGFAAGEFFEIRSDEERRLSTPLFNRG